MLCVFSAEVIKILYLLFLHSQFFSLSMWNKIIWKPGTVDSAQFPKCGTSSCNFQCCCFFFSHQNLYRSRIDFISVIYYALVWNPKCIWHLLFLRCGKVKCRRRFTWLKRKKIARLTQYLQLTHNGHNNNHFHCFK